MRLNDDKALIGIIANCTSPANRKDLVSELGEANQGFFPPLKFSYKDQSGEIVPLDIQPHEVLCSSGMNKGREAMLNAVEYLVDRGAKVICFTASTKRLPGRCGQEVKKQYPKVTFSIGDNATTVSCLKTISHFLTQGFDKVKDEVVIMGLGFLGLKALECLLQSGCQNITVISEQKNCLPKGVRVVNSPHELRGKIKLYISCSHKYVIDHSCFRQLLHPEAIILDVAVPPGIGRELYFSLPPSVSRYDIGDLFLEDIRYSFPPQILNFPKVGIWYGCFGEAVMLELARQAGEDLEGHNFFDVTDTNQELLTKYLHQEGARMPLINLFAPDHLEYISL